MYYENTNKNKQYDFKFKFKTYIQASKFSYNIIVERCFLVFLRQGCSRSGC